MTVTASASDTRTRTPVRTASPTQTPQCDAVWSIVTSPNPGSTGNDLNGVAAISANDVWAVGVYGIGSQGHAMSLHWGGSQWSYVPSPDSGLGDDFLSAVAAISANDVWAVGNTRTNPLGNLIIPLIEHWN